MKRFISVLVLSLLVTSGASANCYGDDWGRCIQEQQAARRQADETRMLREELERQRMQMANAEVRQAIVAAPPTHSDALMWYGISLIVVSIATPLIAYAATK